MIESTTERSFVLDQAAPKDTFDGPVRLSPVVATIALWLVSCPAPRREEHAGAIPARPSLPRLGYERITKELPDAAKTAPAAIGELRRRLRAGVPRRRRPTWRSKCRDAHLHSYKGERAR
jgi:hypothetical protein